MAKSGNAASELYSDIDVFLEAGIPILLTGPPGVGKTGYIHDLRKRKIQGKPVSVISMIASNRESTDVGGYPAPGQIKLSTGDSVDVVRFLPIDWSVQAKDQLENQGMFTIVFIDEYRDITPPVLAALNKCVHENKVGDFDMPAEVRWIAAANSIEDSTVGVALPLPTANRWAHLPWDIHKMVGSWCEGMIGNAFALQSPLSGSALERLGRERALVASFIHKRQELIHVVPKSEDEKDGPWPSPRTLDYTAHVWAAAGEGNREQRLRLAAACIGHYAAAEFIAWEKSMNLPDPEDVLSGKVKKIVVNDRPDVTYATLSSVVSVVVGKWTKERYIQAWKCMARTADDGAGDIAAALVPALENTTDGRSGVPDPSEHLKSLLPILARAGVQLR